MTSHPLIVSYYTPSYKAHADELRRSIDKLELEHRIEPRESTGKWIENCARKAVFIQEMRQATRRPVLWIDADAILRRPLYELIGSTADLAAVKRDGWSFMGGQVYFGTGPAADFIMDRWCSISREYPHIFDQVALGYAWWEAVLEMNVKVEWLPERLFKKMSRNPVKRFLQMRFSRAVILHKQASRQSATKPLHKSFSNWDLPHWWREAAARNAPFPITPDLKAELGL